MICSMHAGFKRTKGGDRDLSLSLLLLSRTINYMDRSGKPNLKVRMRGRHGLRTERRNPNKIKRELNAT